MSAVLNIFTPFTKPSVFVIFFLLLILIHPIEYVQQKDMCKL